MPTMIAVPDEIVEAAEQAAHRCGSSTEQLLISALRNQFVDLPEELLDEMAAWELASETDFARVELEHGLG